MIEKELYALLSTDEAIASRVGSRIYPVRRPQDSELPAITYFLVTGRGGHTHDGPDGLKHPLFQFSIWTKTREGVDGYLEGIEIAALVRRRLDGLKLGIIEGIFLENEGPDLYEDDTEIHHRPLDFRVHHSEARA